MSGASPKTAHGRKIRAPLRRVVAATGRQFVLPSGMVLGYISALMRHSRQPTTAVLTLLLLGMVVATPAPAKLRPIKLAAQAGRVKKGTERQTCFPIACPRSREGDVDHVQIFVHGGSHHVHLYRPTAGPVEYPNPDKTYSPAGPHNRRPRECAFAIDFSHWELVAATQSANLNWQLHPGVGIHFLPQQPLLIQTHFVNTGFGSAELAVKGRARAKMLLYPMNPGAVTARGREAGTPAGRGPRVGLHLAERQHRDVPVRPQHPEERALQPVRVLLPDRHPARGDRLRAQGGRVRSSHPRAVARCVSTAEPRSVGGRLLA